MKTLVPNFATLVKSGLLIPCPVISAKWRHLHPFCCKWIRSDIPSMPGMLMSDTITSGQFGCREQGQVVLMPKGLADAFSCVSTLCPCRSNMALNRERIMGSSSITATRRGGSVSFPNGLLSSIRKSTGLGVCHRDLRRTREQTSRGSDRTKTPVDWSTYATARNIVPSGKC